MVCECGHLKLQHHSWYGTSFDNGRNTGECKICGLRCREYRKVERKTIEVKSDS